MNDSAAPHRSSAVQGVLFDLGGTLLTYRSRQRLVAAADEALRRLGLDPTTPEVRAARRRAAEEVEREFAMRSYFLHRDLFRERVARTAGLLGVEASATVLEQFTEENTRDLVEYLPPRDDAIATLRAMRSRGLYCAVVSNADDDYLDAALRRHGLDGVLDDWTSSEAAASCKPDRAIFEVALGKSRLTADEVLFVGDSLPHDIGGAHAVGMRSVLIRDDTVITPLTAGLDATVVPDFEVDQLTDLLAIIDRLNGNA